MHWNPSGKPDLKVDPTGIDRNVVELMLFNVLSFT
jgi:hypothetical protein